MSDTLRRLHELATDAVMPFDRWAKRGRIAGDDEKIRRFSVEANPVAILKLLANVNTLIEAARESIKRPGYNPMLDYNIALEKALSKFEDSK